MDEIIQKHKFHWKQKNFLLKVFFGVILLLISLYVNVIANSYSTLHASKAVTDIILDNLPVIDVDGLYSWGIAIFIIVLGMVLVSEPKWLPFVLKSLAMFIFVRALFMSLTHLAPPAGNILIGSDLTNRLSSGSDLFFSGHSGLPFLVSLIFWDKKLIRYLFIVLAFLGGTIVLLGHIHYSIDVFSALFIAFGIYHISRNIFRKDLEYAEKVS